MIRIQRIPKILSEPTKLNIKKHPTKAQKILTNDGIIQINVIGIKTVNAQPYPVITRAIGVSPPKAFIIKPINKGNIIPAP